MLGYDTVEELLQRNLADDIYFDPPQRDELIRRFEPRRLRQRLRAAVAPKGRRADLGAAQRSRHHVRQGTLYFEGFVYDITERKRAEEMLRKQSAAMTASMDGIGIVDERLEFTYLNDALAKLFGFPSRTRCSACRCAISTSRRTASASRTRSSPIVHQRGRWRGEANGLRRDGLTSRRRSPSPPSRAAAWSASSATSPSGRTPRSRSSTSPTTTR